MPNQYVPGPTITSELRKKSGSKAQTIATAIKEDGGSSVIEILHVTETIEDNKYVYTLDKTYDEIEGLFRNGVICVVLGEDEYVYFFRTGLYLITQASPKTGQPDYYECCVTFMNITSNPYRFRTEGQDRNEYPKLAINIEEIFGRE